jgi:hypothetical protein
MIDPRVVLQHLLHFVRNENNVSAGFLRHFKECVRETSPFAATDIISGEVELELELAGSLSFARCTEDSMEPSISADESPILVRNERAMSVTDCGLWPCSSKSFLCTALISSSGERPDRSSVLPGITVQR